MNFAQHKGKQCADGFIKEFGPYIHRGERERIQKMADVFPDFGLHGYEFGPTQCRFEFRFQSCNSSGTLIVQFYRA